jgi:hypothetical protein
MTFCADLAPLDYFGPELAKVCVAVGWLDREFPFATGPSDVRVYRRLQELRRDPFQPFIAAGGHLYNLCQFDAEGSDGTNLFIPAHGSLLVAPALVVHYVNAHHYQLPPTFADAVLACPDMRSMDYKRLFLESGGREIMRLARGNVASG